MLMLCALTCLAQESERLPDGTLLVLIGGQRYRAIPADRMRELVNALEDKTLLERKVQLLEQQIAQQERLQQLDARERQLHAEQVAALQTQINLYKNLFEKADNAARPGRIRRFLDSPFSAIVLEIIVPAVTLALKVR